jgi:probable rRNA maturation factor
MIIFRKPVAGLNETALARFTARAQRAIGLEGEVNVLVASNEELQALNSRFRGKRQPTDVLSFPAMAKAGSVTGDLAISADLAALNAQGLGHATAEEVKILIVHGLLHLAGYDHEQDHGEMARQELRLRQRLGLPAGLMERYHPQDVVRLGALAAKRRAAVSKVQRRTRSAARTGRQKAR